MFDSGLKKAKVSKVYPGGHSVDLVFYEDNARASNVKVLNGSICSTKSGSSGLHAPDDAPGGQWDIQNSKTKDIQAIVGFLNGVPFVIGFLHTQDTQMLFDLPEFSVYRHPSDVYFTIDQAGNTEFFHPSGLYFRIGALTPHVDLTGLDFNKLWKITHNTTPGVQFHMQQAGNTASINIAANGAMAVASSVSMDFTSPAINFHGPITADQTIVATGNVTGQGTSLHTHVHTDPQGGNTGQPV